MKFCPECDSLLTKTTTAAGTIAFKCKCALVIEGAPVDTLMHDEFIETTESNLKHEILLENSPFDPAANLVPKPCHKCSMPYLTMVRIGVNETTIYTCTCGYRATHHEYMRQSEELDEEKK